MDIAPSFCVGNVGTVVTTPLHTGRGWGWVFFSSLLRNHLRRFHSQDLVEVVSYYEEDDEGGEHEGTEDGEGGGQEFCHGGAHAASCPFLQEDVEEDYEGCADHGGYADEPQVEAAEEQDDVPSLGAMYLAQRHFLLSRTGVQRYGAPDAHQADDEADGG